MSTPLKSKVWLALPDRKYLTSPYRLYKDSRPIEAVEPFTISLVSCRIAEDLDGFLRGGNDILIASKSAIGSNPPVERIHFYGKDIPAGEMISNLFANNVLIVDEYTAKERLWLEINIIEVDTDDGERMATITALQSLVKRTGAAFPVLAPYAYPFSRVISAINKIFSKLERNQEVIRVPFSLFPSGQITRGRAPLQVGVYVVFPEPQYGNAFKMDDSGVLWTTEDRQADVTYASFAVVPGRSVSTEYLRNQKLATLLTQIRADNDNSDRSTFDFLQDTLQDYQNFRMLERYKALQNKLNRSEAETTRMEEIYESYPMIRPYVNCKC